jgi:hypothetical protein
MQTDVVFMYGLSNEAFGLYMLYCIADEDQTLLTDDFIQSHLRMQGVDVVKTRQSLVDLGLIAVAQETAESLPVITITQLQMPMKPTVAALVSQSRCPLPLN